jgi:hypothetical protein
MRFLIVLSLVLLSASVPAQVEHAPTVAQCQADYKLWDATLGRDASKVSYKTLTDWEQVMAKCMDVDDEHRTTYLILDGTIITREDSRLVNFLMRENLYKKFVEEDEAGAR